MGIFQIQGAGANKTSIALDGDNHVLTISRDYKKGHWAYEFESAQWERLEFLISTYKHKDKKLGLDGYTPNVEWRYFKTSKTTGLSLIDRLILDHVECFDFDYSGMNLHIQKSFALFGVSSDVENNYIAIYGDAFHSLAREYFMMIFNWMEFYLLKSPKSIRIEFWLLSYNESVFDLLKEFVEGLREYVGKESHRVLNTYWYYMQDDEDVEHDGWVMKNTLLPELNLICLDEIQYNKMTKKLV